MKIFISHSSADNPIVKKIVERLDKYRIEYWVDQKELRGEGHSLWSEISDGLDTSDHFLLVWSKPAKSSENVKKEFMSIIGPEHDELIVRIILRIDDTRLWRISSDLKNHSNVSEENIENVMDEIINNILEIDTSSVDDFDEYLDLSFDEIKLDDTYYLFSTVLKRVDSTKYNIMFHEFLAQKIEEEEEND